MLYSQKDVDSPLKESHSSVKRGEVASYPVKGYEWVLNLVKNKDSSFHNGLNDPMYQAIAGEVIHGCLTKLYKETITGTSDMETLLGCALPNNAQVTTIMVIFNNTPSIAKIVAICYLQG